MLRSLSRWLPSSLLSPAVARRTVGRGILSRQDHHRDHRLFAAGASNDFYVRAVARNMGRHIPGNPTVVPRNMPGGGSLVAANHIFNVAPKDGTTLGLIAADGAAGGTARRVERPLQGGAVQFHRPDGADTERHLHGGDRRR